MFICRWWWHFYTSWHMLRCCSIFPWGTLKKSECSKLGVEPTTPWLPVQMVCRGIRMTHNKTRTYDLLITSLNALKLSCGGLVGTTPLNQVRITITSFQTFFACRFRFPNADHVTGLWRWPGKYFLSKLDIFMFARSPLNEHQRQGFKPPRCS